MAKLVTSYPGIIVHLRLAVLKQMVLLKEQYAESRKETSAVLLQSGLDEKWWADSVECYCYLRNVQDLTLDGKTPYDRQFGEPFSGPTIRFGSMIDHHPISAKDQATIHARRLDAKEMITPKKWEHFIFTIGDATVKLSGGGQGIRNSTEIRDQLVTRKFGHV